MTEKGMHMYDMQNRSVYGWKKKVCICITRM